MEQSMRMRGILGIGAARRPRALLPWALFAAASLCTLAELLFALLNERGLARLFAEWILSQATASLAFAAVGALIAAHRPRNRIGWLFCALGAGGGALGLVSQYTRYALVTAPGTVPGGQFAAWVNMWAFVPYMVAVAVAVPLVFPDGRLPSARWRPLAGAAALGALLLTLNAAVTPGAVDASLPEVANPIGHSALARALYGTLQTISPLSILLCLAGLVGAVAAPIVRFRRGDRAARLQIKWFALATALLVAAFVAPVLVYGRDFTAHTLLSGVLLAIALPLLPAAVGVSVLRHRLWDIDLVINRTLVYSVLTACVVGLYVGIVGYLGALFRTGGNPLISLAAAGAVAVLFQPLREHVQRAVNRLVYGERDEPQRILERLGRRLEGTLAPDAVLPAIVTTLKDALKLPYAAIALPLDEEPALAAEAGTAVRDPMRLPLSYQGETVGWLLVGARDGDDWSPADRRVLADVARHAGVAVHGVQVMAALRRSREQLVLAREEERRRLRGDLHDDLAPTLAALGLQAATAAALIPGDPARAIAAVEALGASLRTAVAGIRRLVYDLRPPALDELGLVEAIRERAALLSRPAPDAGGTGAALQVRVDLPEELPALPAAVEVAAYRIVQEALMNVLRHAQARSCTVRLACAAGERLDVEIVDDGVGLPDARGAGPGGVGLRSMRERALELGGVCTVERAAPRGTRVRASVPLTGAGKGLGG